MSRPYGAAIQCIHTHVYRLTSYNSKVPDVRTGNQVATNWSTFGDQLVRKWSPSDQQVVSKWSPSGYHLGTLPDHLVTSPDHSATLPDHLGTLPDHLGTPPDHLGPFGDPTRPFVTLQDNFFTQLVTIWAPYQTI